MDKEFKDCSDLNSEILSIREKEDQNQQIQGEIRDECYADDEIQSSQSEEENNNSLKSQEGQEQKVNTLSSNHEISLDEQENQGLSQEQIGNVNNQIYSSDFSSSDDEVFFKKVQYNPINFNVVSMKAKQQFLKQLFDSNKDTTVNQKSKDQSEFINDIIILEHRDSKINDHQVKDTLNVLINSSNNYREIIIKMQMNYIGDFGVNLIGSALSNQNQIQKLTIQLHKNQIGDQGIKNLSLGLKDKPNLEYLCIWISNNNFSGDILKQLGDQISKLEKLKTLILNLNCTKITSFGLNSISQNLTQLENISIEANQCAVDNKCLIEFGNVIKNLCSLKYLKILIGENKLDDEGISQFAFDLAGCINLNYLIISLNKNIIKEKGISQLGKFISQCPSLQYLKITFNNCELSSQAISEYLYHIKYSQSIKELITCFKDQNEFENDILISKFLLNESESDFQNSTIEKISIFFPTKTANNSYSIIGKYLLEFKKLKDLEIDLWNCQIDNPSLVLNSIVQPNQNIIFLKVNLLHNQIGQDQFIQLGSQISKINQLKSLDLTTRQNLYESYDIRDFMKKLSKCDNLIYVKLDIKCYDQVLYLDFHEKASIRASLKYLRKMKYLVHYFYSV